MADHSRDPQTALRDDAVLIEVAAIEVRVGHDGAASDLVEGDVLGREVGRAGDDDGMTNALRILQGPRQGLHAAQAAAHDGSEPLNAKSVEQRSLRIDPVFDRHHREVGAVDAAGRRVGVHGTGRAEARAQVVDADDEEAIGVEWLARADHVVPPAFRLLLTFVHARDVVRGIERMAHQHRVALVGIELAVAFPGKRVIADRRAASQSKRPREEHRLRNNDHVRTRRRQKRAGSGIRL